MSIHSNDIRKVFKTWRIDSNIPLFYFNLFEENNFRGENDDFREPIVAGGGSIGKVITIHEIHDNYLPVWADSIKSGSGFVKPKDAGTDLNFWSLFIQRELDCLWLLIAIIDPTLWMGLKTDERYLTVLFQNSKDIEHG